ncbi:MAG TPA: hypothetical protein VF839_06390 [Clostridium sp.]
MDYNFTGVEQLFNYNDPTGIPHQKIAGLNLMESFRIHADTEHMAIVSGAQNALAIRLCALFEPEIVLRLIFIHIQIL